MILDARVSQVWVRVPLSGGLLAVSEYTPQDLLLFFGCPFKHLRCYDLPHIHKGHSRTKMDSTFLDERGKSSAYGAFLECDTVAGYEEGILVRVCEVWPYAFGVNVHELIEFRQYQADGWPMLGTLMSCHQHYFTVLLHLPLCVLLEGGVVQRTRAGASVQREPGQ